VSEGSVLRWAESSMAVQAERCEGGAGGTEVG